MFLVENEDIFAFRDRPDAATYLGQGLATVLWNPVAAAWDSLLNVIVLPAFPVGLAGLIALAGMWRSPCLRRPTALMAVLISALLIFVTTMLLFPVATLWGTFMHSSGPLLVGLGVMAALGGDALLARVSTVRGVGEAQRHPRAHRAGGRGRAADGLPGQRLLRPVAWRPRRATPRWRDVTCAVAAEAGRRRARDAHHRPPHVAGRGPAATPSPCPTRTSTPSCELSSRSRRPGWWSWTSADAIPRRCSTTASGACLSADPTPLDRRREGEPGCSSWPPGAHQHEDDVGTGRFNAYTPSHMDGGTPLRGSIEPG